MLNALFDSSSNEAPSLSLAGMCGVMFKSLGEKQVPEPIADRLLLERRWDIEGNCHMGRA